MRKKFKKTKTTLISFTVSNIKPIKNAANEINDTFKNFLKLWELLSSHDFGGGWFGQILGEIGGMTEICR